MARQIKQHQIKPQTSLRGEPIEHKLPVQGLSHIIGQAAAIRFFDEDSREDFEAINEILTHKQIRNWMDDAGKLSWSDYKYWAGNHTNQSFLFSVHDSRPDKPSEVKRVRGFVNIYSERGEKFRVKRMAKLKILKDTTSKQFLEFSMALRPLKKGQITGSGLMSSGLRQSCLQVKSLLNKKESDLVIFGFIDPKNTASIRAITASGFLKKGKARYDSTSDENSDVYILSWRKLRKIVEKKMETALRKKTKVIIEPQITDSHCGPAVVKALLGFYNIDVSQDDVVNAAQVKSTIMKHGMNPKQIALVVEKLSQDLKFWYKQNTKSSDIEKLVHECKIPVAVNWQGLFYDSPKYEKKHHFKNGDYGHFSIVIDINKSKDEITIDDPYSEYFSVPRVFSYKWFRSRWWDQDIRVDNKANERKIIKTKKLIFVVTPKTYKFPPSLQLKEVGSLKELESLEKN